MAIRIPWDQYEAAYLLLVCIDVIENHTDRATAIKKVSETLRKRALHNGIEIDSMYRNENGISMQMTIMTSLYLHKKSGLHGASKLFVDTVELYEKNPKAIKDRIENLVEGGAKLNMSNKEKFYKWLIASVRPGDVSNVRRRCDLVDVYIKNHKKFNTSIYELNNPQDVQRIKTFIEKDVFFKAKNSRQIYHILKSMEIFYDFVTDYSKTIAEEPNLCNLNIVNQDYKEKEFVKFSFEDKLAYTKPVSIEYNGNIYSDFSNWTQLYVRVLKILFKENKNILIDLCGKNITGTGRVEIATIDQMDQMIAPKEYWELYEERKALLKKLCCNDSKQIEDYCDWVMEKESKTLYYLTDATKKEINLIFEMIEKYADDYSKDELLGVLKHISSDLYLYLQNYDYKHELLNDYFSDYKYQKVTNKITTEFRALVEKQAVDREYLRILPARSEKTESIDMQNTAVYFVDAMGVEYMAYIMSLCREFNLMTYTTLCHCEVPSITSKNKDFVEVFENHGGVFIPDKNGIKTLDEMKHHGTDNFDFVNNHLPTYLYDELKVIRKVLEEVNSKLQKYDRVVLISDHGASRLSVISGQENKHEMNEKGIHSGRCCPKSEADEKPSCAIDGEDFWVLANYDRFKGSRPANIEVHGGATLEEVVVPIIEITRPAAIYEFKMSTPTN